MGGLVGGCVAVAGSRRKARTYLVEGGDLDEGDGEEDLREAEHGHGGEGLDAVQLGELGGELEAAVDRKVVMCMGDGRVSESRESICPCALCKETQTTTTSTHPNDGRSAYALEAGGALHELGRHEAQAGEHGQAAVLQLGVAEPVCFMCREGRIRQSSQLSVCGSPHQT